jgi:hypothetical protein
MSTPPPDDAQSPLDHLALRYLRAALDTTHPTDEPYVLNAVETYVIRRVKLQTLLLAALLGITGVLLLYMPQYWWPSFFPSLPITILDWSVRLPVVLTLYGILLVYLEIYALMYINLRAVRIIMAVCQFPRAHDAQYERHLKALAQAALEREDRGILRFGIDPYLGLPRWGLSAFFLVNMFKATLSNMLVKVVLKRVLGRYALRYVTDLAGMPIFAFWNALASWSIIHEVQIRVMAPLTIREFVHELHEEWGDNETFRSLILETLQYVAVLKRQYNYAHFLLTENIVDAFGIELSDLSGNFIERADVAPVEVRRGLERLIVFGVLIDGRLSWSEKKRLQKLRENGWLIHYPADTVTQLGRDYNNGKGLWV